MLTNAQIWLYSLISVFIVSLISLIGVFTLAINQEKIKKASLLLVSFAVGGLFGDAVHNLIDGMVVCASYLISFPLGISTTLAVIFHEIPHEIGNFGVLIHSGFSAKKAVFFNFLTALAAIFGGFLTLVIGSKISGFSTFLLPITAGGFLYIAGSDLLPELHHEINPKNSFLQLVFMISGAGIMALLLIFSE